MDRPKNSRCYDYDSLAKAYIWLGIIGSVIFVLASLFFVCGVFYVQFIREKQFSFFLTSFSLAFAIFSILFFVTIFNLKTKICVDEHYLYVNFFFTQKSARLEDIISVKRVFTPARKQSLIVVFKRGLTPVHRIYGWIYGHSICPGVYVGGSISDRDELERLLNMYL
jgi:hypothetical protein